MANDLEIKIGASITDLKSALNKAGYEVKKFGEQTEGVANNNNKLGKSSTNAAGNIRNLTGALKGSSASMGDVAEAGLDVVDELGSVSSATGALSGALTAGLAVALLTAAVALTKYAFRLSDAAVNAEKLRAATKKLIGSAQSEITTYNALLKVAKDETRSKEERVRALAKVNEKSGKYIGNLSLESLKSGEATKATDKYSEALLQQAKIKGLQSRLSDLYAKQFDIETRSIEENTTWYEKAASSLAGYATGQGNLTAASYLATQGAKNQKEELASLDAQITKLTGSLGTLISEDVSTKGIFTSPKAQQKELEQIRAHSQNVLGAMLEAKGLIEPIAQGIQAATSLTPMPEKLSADEMRYQNHLLALNNAMTEFESQADNIINNGIANTFGNLGNVIGESLASGGNILNAGGAALLGSLGGILVNLGKMAIQVGIGIKAVKTALQSLNPVAAIAAGVGLIALGSAFKSGASKLASGSGGSSSGSGSIGGGGSSFGSSTPRSNTNSGGGGFSGGTVVFEIAGQKLIGVLSNTLERNRALGGSLNLTGS